MSDVVTTEQGSAVLRVPEYVTPATAEGIRPITALPDLESGFLKMLAIRNGVRGQYGSYSRDTTLTSFFSDMINWSVNGDERTSREFAPVISRFKSELRDDEAVALKEFFKSNATLWDDILSNIDDRQDIGSGIENLTPEQRRETLIPWAQFNQKLAAAFFHASHLDQQDPERIKMESFVAFIGALDKSGAVRGSGQYRELIVGARSQAAMMNTLNRLGCFIVVPDYDDEAEMRETDLSGVDFAAITPDGKMLLVDAKGRQVNHDGSKVRMPEVSARNFSQFAAKRRVMNYLRGVPQEVQGSYSGISLALREAHNGRAESLMITFPTSSNILDMGDIKPEFREIFENSLARALSIPNQTEHEIDIR